MLNLNASLTKAGVQYSSLVERGFHRRLFPRRPAPLAGGRDPPARYQPRAPAFRSASCRPQAEETGARLAAELRRDKAIMGVFDEGCMGMYNAIIPDELLHPTGRLQGAPEPVGALRGDARDQRR